MQKIQHGIFDESTVILNPRPISSIFPINSHEFICTSNREISRIENDDVKETALFSFSCACLIPEVELIVAHTISGAEMYIMRMYDLQHPIVSKFKSGHICVYHILYSPKSKAIITIGSGVKVFTISWEYTGARLLTSNSNIQIVLRSSFADDFDAPMVNTPSFDYERELLFLPTENGVYGFDLDGNKKLRASRLPANLTTIYAYCHETKKLLTADATSGICLWKKNGYIKKKIDILSYVIIALHFVDPENVICLSSTYCLYLLNVKTGTSSLSFTCPPNRRLTRFFVVPHLKRMYAIMIFSNKMNFLRIDNLCHIWASNLIRPLSISVCSKYYEAPRIAVFTDNSFVKLYNPRNGFQLTAATSSNPSIPISYFYDRGILIHYVKDANSNRYTPSFLPTDYGIQRDCLFIICQDGAICKFDTMQTPASQIWIKDYKALYMATVYYKNRWCYAIIGIYGRLSFVDIDTFEKIKDIHMAKRPVRFMLYHFPTNSLIFMMKKSLKLFSLETEHFAAKVRIPPTDLAYLHGDIVYLPYKNGKIYRYTVTKSGFQYTEPDVLYDPHTDSVTSMDFGLDYYLSASFDKTCLIWNYDHVKLLQIELPFPIYSIAFQGPKRNVLVGIKDEIMIIPGDVLFDNDDGEPEIKEIDNYDLLYDPLDPQILAKRNFDEITEAKSLMNHPQDLKSVKAQNSTLSDIELLPVSEPSSSINTIVVNTPEMKKKKIDQMYSLLNLGKAEESALKLLANQNARQFILRSKIESQQKLDSKASVNTIEVQPKVQNSIQPKKSQPNKVAACDFIKNQIEIEDNSKKNPRRNKKKKMRKATKANECTEKAKTTNINLLELLNKKTNIDKLSKTSPRVTIDISQMKFVECTENNKEEPKEVEYEYYSDYSESNEETPKKKKRRSVQKKSARPNQPPNARKRSNTVQPNKKTSNKDSPKTAHTNNKKKETATPNTKSQKKTKPNVIQRQRHNTIVPKSKKAHLTNSKKQNKKTNTADEYEEERQTKEFVDENGNAIALNQGEYINSDGDIIKLSIFEYINEDGEVCEFPEGRFVNENGQIVNENGDLIDENGEVISADERKWYLYLDEYGKIQRYIEEEEKRHPNFDNCIFYDESGRIINKRDVFLNDLGEYVNIFGEVLTRCEIVETEDGDNLLENGLLFNDGQPYLVNEDGEPVDANGEQISSNAPQLKIEYADAACQWDEQLIQRSINAKIRRLKRYFHPKNQGYRPATPPPIRWDAKIESKTPDKKKSAKIEQTNSVYLKYIDQLSSSKHRRSRTPPQLRSKGSINERIYTIPPPQYVLDCEAVLSIYGRGHTELLPIIYRMIREGLVSPLKVPIPTIPSNDENKIESNMKSIEPIAEAVQEIKTSNTIQNSVIPQDQLIENPNHTKKAKDEDVLIEETPPTEEEIINEEKDDELPDDIIIHEPEIVKQEEEEQIEVIKLSDDDEIQPIEMVTEQTDKSDDLPHISIGTSTLSNELTEEEELEIIEEPKEKNENIEEKTDEKPPEAVVEEKIEIPTEEVKVVKFKPQPPVDSKFILKEPAHTPKQSFAFWRSSRKIPVDNTFQFTSCIAEPNEDEHKEEEEKKDSNENFPAPRKLHQDNEDKPDDNVIRKKRNRHRDISPPSPRLSYVNLPLYEQDDIRRRPPTIRLSTHHDKASTRPKEKKQKEKSHGTIKDYSFLLQPDVADKMNDQIYEKKAFEEEVQEDFIFSLKSMFPKTNHMTMMIQKENPEAVLKAPDSEMRNDSSIMQEKKSSRKRGISVKKKTTKKNKTKTDHKKRQKSVDPKRNKIPDYVFLPTFGQRSYLYV